MKKNKVTCDLIIPVHNNLSLAKDCLESIIKYTAINIYNNIIIIDDHSDSHTRQYLDELAQDYKNIHAYHNKENLGFVKSSNIGLSHSNAEHIVLINSDVIVTPNWLEKLLVCAESDARIATVNPITNHASQINLPIMPGLNFFDMNWNLSKYSPSFPDIVTGVGFCFMVRRSVIDELGFFDEIFGHGYCEESDLCMRFTANGYRTVLADNVYVFHKGCGSFTDRNERYLRNRKIFDQRWFNEYRKQFSKFRKKKQLNIIRRRFALTTRWDPMPVVLKTARTLHTKWQQRDLSGMLPAMLRGGVRALKNRREIPTAAIINQLTPPEKLKVTYVLQDLLIAGGVLSAIQLVNELILLGVDARLVALYEDPALYDWTKLLTKPIIFKNKQELLSNFPETEIAIATLWSTAEWVHELKVQDKVKYSVYFVQDYEPWFFSAKDHLSRQKVKQTYHDFEYIIVKSNWLKNMLKNEDGVDAEKILLGMDLARFYPRDIKDKQSTKILSMARPKTTRRGFDSTIQALYLVKQKHPKVEISLFGDRFLSSYEIPFEYSDKGIVTNQDDLANLYSQSDIFLDGSDFQGFGRCALEAMACACACVVTSVGGVTEYAIHKENCLIVEPKQPKQFADAIIRLINNNELRDQLIQQGLHTVKQYCHKREAVDTLAFFKKIAQAG